jgi:hypothetical protein
MHAPTEDKSDDMKDNFNKEPEQVFKQFPKYHIKTTLGDFNAKVRREDILKQTLQNKSLYEISNE